VKTAKKGADQLGIDLGIDWGDPEIQLRTFGLSGWFIVLLGLITFWFRKKKKKSKKEV
jgi:hypothetical protein